MSDRPPSEAPKDIAVRKGVGGEAGQRDLLGDLYYAPAAAGEERAGVVVVHGGGWRRGKPVQNRWRRMADVPATTPLSDRISKDLKGRGFTFVGTTIVYAHMQATGMVNDHLLDCFRHAEVRLA